MAIGKETHAMTLDGRTQRGSEAVRSTSGYDITPLSDDLVASPAANVSIGDTVEFTRPGDELKSSTKFEVTGPGDTQSLEIHTSCSKALNCLDRFGSMRLVELETPGVHLGLSVQNEAAYGLYRAVGFHELTRHDDAIYMGLRLSPDR